MSFVYFALSTDGRMKIGYSANPLERMNALPRQMRADRVTLVKVTAGDRRREREVQRAFGHLLVLGREVFTATPELLSFVDAQPDAPCAACRQYFPKRVVGSMRDRKQYVDWRKRAPENFHYCTTCKQRIALPLGRSSNKLPWRKLNPGEAEIRAAEGWEISYESIYGNEFHR